MTSALSWVISSWLVREANLGMFFVRRDVCCGLLKAAELALVLLYWHFTGADLISSTDCNVFIEFYRGFPGCKGLSLYRKFRDPDVF